MAENSTQGDSSDGVYNNVPKTPDYCPFSVEIEPSRSQGLDHLHLSTVNNSWSLAMKTTAPSSHSLLSNESDCELSAAAEEECPLNKMDASDLDVKQVPSKDEAPPHGLMSASDLDVKRALSNEQAPHGLVPVSSDSESSSRDDSLDVDTDDADTDDEEAEGILRVDISPDTPGARMAHLHSPPSSDPSCVLSPRPSRTPTRGEPEPQCQDTPGAVPLNPLNHLKVLNPGIPHGHTTHVNQRHSKTPQRHPHPTPHHQQQLSTSTTMTATSSSGVATTSAADCIYQCFAIEDFTQFFCPATPKSTTVDATTTQPSCPNLPSSNTTGGGMGCLPPYNYDFENASSSTVAFTSIPGFWSHPHLPRSRGESAINTKLPRNRAHSLRRKRVRKLLDVWHGSINRNFATQKSMDDAALEYRRQRCRKRNHASQLYNPNYCYDSDPEYEVVGRRQRREALLFGRRWELVSEKQYWTETFLLQGESQQEKQQPRYRKFRPCVFTHLDTDEESQESTSDAEESSSELFESRPPLPPRTPRNSDSKISFLFGGDTMDDSENDADIDSSVHTRDTKSKENVEQEEQGVVAFEFGKANKPRIAESHRRNPSSTSLSTTGHSRFPTIRRAAEQAQEEYSSESSMTSSSPSDSDPTCSNTNLEMRRLRTNLLPSYFKSHPTYWTEFQLLFSRNVDEEAVKSHVHELSNVKFPLIWHPAADSVSCNSRAKQKVKAKDDSAKTTEAISPSCPTSAKIASLSSSGTHNNTKKGSTSNKSRTLFPIAVDGAFEVGSHLEHMVVQPKFTWTPLAQPNLEEEEDSHDPTNGKNSRELFLSESAPPQVELLSIIRVNKACAYNQWDRNRYPYARLDRTCVVSTNDPKHSSIVLEARSSQERDWLVFALKLIVARLASIIITRDEDMLHEFFSPYSALMQLEDEDKVPQPEDGNGESKRKSQLSASSESSSESNSESTLSKESEPSTIESAATPTAEGSCAGNSVLVIDDESENYVFPGVDEETPQTDDDETSESVQLGDDDDDDDDVFIAFDNEEDDDTNMNEDDNDDSICQDRDDRDQEDSVRARNSGACAILRRSLTSTGVLVEHDETWHHNEDEMVRTLSY
eukprot:CAMPEP_0172387106 /NCGR_PEP_ID=MMETSP1061-20121228/4499_1 /TAXON_ID=37318 /ORGANISM="Pseudo-nitzschia pungens, Strain cf. pungens" /LENGTH=1103 /DNA_ID=CAMNT_0013116675 /DNA_START=518 /DNA_END=3829 /DNA_ORIENTATION=+